MDIAYNQHSPHSRRHNRSPSNLTHLTLAPLTSKLPPSKDDYFPDHISYIENRSQPTTPSILSRSSSRVSLRKPAPINISIPKSKSSIHLTATPRTPHIPGHRSGTTTPSRHSHLRNTIAPDNLHISTYSEKDRNDSDWLLRAGAMISSSTREYKGQSWLVSRASSTSLQRDADDDAFERELAREREHNSRRGSRRGSFDADDEFSPLTTRRSLSFGPATGALSRPMSGYGSRANSRRGSRAALVTSMTADKDAGYFDSEFAHEEYPAEPDFVDVEEEGFESGAEARKDEAMVKKLARASRLGLGGWVESLLGWSLFAVEEDGEETEFDTPDEKGEESPLSSRPSRHMLDGLGDTPVEEQMPPLNPNEADGWHDAAWLLSVASKVLL
ncbi:hypothetical protein SBOR_7047 [Sclerotinia borealis F-4128]|uniref:Uncharacterized protein n=1 Tax=Sclerotinia borealis (strain F-4128) TaxID=1432307 RepID=W9C722_SCLBF|nr:hypothetical protein SBOR_7047 [Sclerotinia borealis F-4128]